jgi:hypothetical protein
MQGRWGCNNYIKVNVVLFLVKMVKEPYEIESWEKALQVSRPSDGHREGKK